MCTVDEDILLSSTDAGHFDTTTTFDEDALLGVGDITRKSAVDSADSVSSLDSAPFSEQPKDNTSETAVKDDDDEELDYDEDDDEEERRERTSRYASEKRKETELPEMDETEENKQVDGNQNGDRTKPEIPSLFDKSITNAIKSKIPRQPIAIKLKLDGGPEQVFLPQYPSRVAPQQIVPRLPNGIPLVSLQPNHGMAGFGNNYSSHMSRMVGGGGSVGMTMPANGQQWDQAVAMFLNGGTTSTSGTSSRLKKRTRSSSYSSYSSSSSGSSRARSRSGSRTPKHRRDKRRREESSRRDRKKYDDRKRSNRDNRDTRDNRDNRRREDQRSKNTTVDSAKALGLSDEYLDKMNEQKRKRDEVLRKKEERRHGGGSSGHINETRRGEKPQRQQETVNRSMVKEQPTTSSSNSTSNISNAERDKKLKAYLAVNVGGVKQLTTAEKRVGQMAAELGPIKKCWRSSGDIISIIFNSHDKAKDFMIKYNNKILSGLRITVSLEKKYLNLSEMG